MVKLSGLIILARMDSRRLPGKALKMLGNRPLLGHVIERAHRTHRVDEIVVATTDRPIDDPIAAYVRALDISLFRGPTSDVATRCLACARAHTFDRFARVCGDSPFFDPDLVAELIRLHESGHFDVATNVARRTFPTGASAEVISTDALERLVDLTHDPTDREHVTPFFYRNPDLFRIVNIVAPFDRYSRLRLAVDDASDAVRTEWMLGQLAERATEASLDELMALALRHQHQAVAV